MQIKSKEKCILYISKKSGHEYPFYDRLYGKERMRMKFIRFFGFLCLLVPCLAWGVDNTEFQNASRLLTAARRGDIQTVQTLINSGVNVNYVDSTGVSLVCTAVMNNDTRAIQILQMYGADASNCERQIKQYRQKTTVAAKGEEYSFFSGLSSTHIVVLSAIGVAAVIGGVALLTNAFDSDNENGNSGSSGNRPNNNPGGGGSSSASTNTLFAQNLPYGPLCSGNECPNDYTVWENDKFGDFKFMSTKPRFNYLMVSRAYNAFVRGYLGATTVRYDSTKEVFDIFDHNKYPFAQDLIGGKPVNVAMITQTGVDKSGSAGDDIMYWFDESKKSSLISLCTNTDGTFSDACRAAVDESVRMSHKYYNLSGATVDGATENKAFNLSGDESVFGSASESDIKLAKIIAGWGAGGRESGQADYWGYVPNGQLTVYKTGAGSSGVSDYKNYAAIYDALLLKVSGENVANVIANLSLTAESSELGYPTVSDAKIWVNSGEDTSTAKKSKYGQLVNMYYDLNSSDNNSSYTAASGAVLSGTQSDNLNNAFVTLYNNQTHIIVNSAGHSVVGFGDGKSLAPQEATFENFAPVIYNDYQNLQNLFATVVAVRPKDGTSGQSIDGYAPSGIELSAWSDPSNSSITYSSRICGLTGNGNGGAMNPWCFAAPGSTDLEATAAMAGSVALVKSAFNYMTPNEIFLLLALTADGPYLGTNPETNSGWTASDGSDLRAYLQGMYNLPGNLDSSDAQYLESFKYAYGYGLINLERATRPGTNVYYYGSNKNMIVSGSGVSYWRKATAATTSLHSSTALSLTNRSAIKTSFFDVIESSDGTISLPRVWNATISSDNNSKHGLYMGDVLGEFSVDSTNKRHNQIGNFAFDMSMSPRAYNDNLNGLDNLRVGFNSSRYDLDAGYQHHLTDGESRFNGRANGVLSLVSNSVSFGAKHKIGNFAFGTRAFSGNISDENLIENDPVVSSQFEPERLGFANGAALGAGYNNDKFGLNVSFGNMNETNTVLGMASDGLLSLNGGNTQYVDTFATYKPFNNTKLSVRATFANTYANIGDGIINHLSTIKSNAFAAGLDIGGFEFTASMPLAVVGGTMGYDYADLDVVENDGKYEIAMNNPHVEYIDLSTQKRELRFSSSYKQSLGEFTDAGIGFIYRVNPNNTDTFGDESILMFKIHHRIGI